MAIATAREGPPATSRSCWRCRIAAATARRRLSAAVPSLRLWACAARRAGAAAGTAAAAEPRRVWCRRGRGGCSWTRAA